MKAGIVTGLMGLGLLIANPLPPEDGCISCHRLIDEDREEKILTHIENDVHLQKDLSCADCHGGNREEYDDPDAAMWEDPSFRGEITKADQPEVCGSCHSHPEYMRQYSASIKTDQVAQYWTSQHGRVLQQGNQKVAACVDCHGVHGIFNIADPRSPIYPLNVPSTCSQCHSDVDYMAEFDIPTDQFYKYRNSVHGRALIDERDTRAPACNDCHGNHGAIPPDVVHITDICGTCHVNNNRLYQESHLQDIFLKRDFGQCRACHGNHAIIKPTDEYLNWEQGAVCVQCHKDAVGGPKLLANNFYQTIDSLKSQIKLARELVQTAEEKGMEASELFFPLEEAHKVLILTRTSIHSFNREFVKGTAQAGFEATQAAIQGAYAALGELNTRRKGLFLYSLLITFLVVLIYVKIKEIDRRKP